MATIGELLHSLKKDDVLAALDRLYQGPGEDAEGYCRMWDTLLVLQPKLTKISCLLSRVWSSDDPPKPHVDVSGIEAGDDTHYAIEFVEWPEWLSMKIVVDSSLAEISEEEKLAHAFYEMTWTGYDQDVIQDQFAEICDRAEEAGAFYGISDEKLN